MGICTIYYSYILHYALMSTLLSLQPTTCIMDATWKYESFAAGGTVAKVHKYIKQEEKVSGNRTLYSTPHHKTPLKSRKNRNHETKAALKEGK